MTYIYYLLVISVVNTAISLPYEVVVKATSDNDRTEVYVGEQCTIIILWSHIFQLVWVMTNWEHNLLYHPACCDNVVIKRNQWETLCRSIGLSTSIDESSLMWLVNYFKNHRDWLFVITRRFVIWWSENDWCKCRTKDF